MTNEELINDEKYHTCGRCKYDNTPDDKYPCVACIHGTDHRTDLWELDKEDADEIQDNYGVPFAKRCEWIPVSERLPENYQRVLVTIVNYYGHKVVRVAEYFDENKEFQIKENEEHWNVGEKGLLAWTPLPEAYKEEE